MCLAIPAKITELGATREISLDLTPQAEIGSYVLVHAGFAIEVVDEQFAQETIDLIKQFPELAGEEMGTAGGPNPQQPSMQATLSSLAEEL